MDFLLRERLGKILDNCKVDYFVIANSSGQDPNFRYLTRFRSGIFENDLLIGSRKGIVLYTSELEYQTALSQKLEGMKVVKVSGRNVKEVERGIKRVLGGKVVGINGGFLNVSKYVEIRKKYKPKKVIDISSSFSSARLVKDAYEIESIEKAASITRRALELIPRYFKEGITELELAKRFDELSASLGSERPSFTTIVCFGKNAALPHHMPDSTRLKKGDFVLIDAGATVNGYCSDMTRTFVFDRDKRLEKEKEMMEIVKRAQELAIEKMRPGVIGSEVDKAARNYIDSALNGKYKGTFIHSLGHSVGLEVHDGFRLSQDAKVVLKENMVFTAEPGVYVPGFGGVRIEDDVLITRKGPVLLGRGELG